MEFMGANKTDWISKVSAMENTAAANFEVCPHKSMVSLRNPLCIEVNISKSESFIFLNLHVSKTRANNRTKAMLLLHSCSYVWDWFLMDLEKYPWYLPWFRAHLHRGEYQCVLHHGRTSTIFLNLYPNYLFNKYIK